MRFQVRMVSCRERDEVRARTLESWRQTDWGAEPPVDLDESDALAVAERIEETWLRALRAALADGAEFALVVEDDLEFNHFLRHNLERWPPLRALQSGDLPFFGSLYRVHQRVLWQNPVQRCALAAPESYWGAQALVVSRGTARYLLDRWEGGGRAHDIKAARLAAQVGPIHCHLPALVQHRIGPSTWGGGTHQAPDFDPRFRSP
jgi:hypothetical protein